MDNHIIMSVKDMDCFNETKGTGIKKSFKRFLTVKNAYKKYLKNAHNNRYATITSFHQCHTIEEIMRDNPKESWVEMAFDPRLFLYNFFLTDRLNGKTSTPLYFPQKLP